MSTLKRAKVVMLPTNEKASGLSILNSGKLNYGAEAMSSTNTKLQHLYFLSDEEIKEADWCYDELNNKVYQASSIVIHNMKSMEYEIYLKKIIATTDKSLTINSIYGVDSFDTSIFSGSGKSEIVKLPQMFNLPQPSQSFIEKFVEEYNKGNVITEVLVEYEDKIAMDGHTIVGQELKINPKDNTITIHKCKDSWSREEVKALALQSFLEGVDRISAEDFDKWIEENL